MGDTPQLPQQISPNGREVWDWADRFSEHVHTQDKIRKLRAAVFQQGRTCGDCSNWMKSRLCPKERNVKGMTRGPSSGDLKCNQFLEGVGATKRRADLSAQLAELDPHP